MHRGCHLNFNPLDAKPHSRYPTYMHFFVSVIGNAIGLLIAVKLGEGIFESGTIVWNGTFVGLLLAGAVIGVVNGLVRPIVKLLSFPLILLTAGIFSFVINIGMLALADYMLADLQIHGILAYTFTSVVLAIVHIFL